MDRLLGKSSNSLDNDKNKPFYSNTRRHYKPFQSSPSAAFRRSGFSPGKGILALVAIVLFYFLLFPSTEPKKIIRLKDQPTYTKHETTCSVVLCNPLNKCSTWLPNKTYTWSQLSEAGIFRDLSTIQVGVGCELRIRVEGRVDGGEWLRIPNGMTECTETGYGTHCRNFVELDLKGKIHVR